MPHKRPRIERHPATPDLVAGRKTCVRRCLRFLTVAGTLVGACLALADSSGNLTKDVFYFIVPGISGLAVTVSAWLAYNGVRPNDLMHEMESTLVNLLDGKKFPRLWDLLRLPFGKDIRERVFDNAIEELKEDLVVYRGKYRSRAARIWIAFWISIRTAVTFIECVRLSFVRPLLAILPSKIRNWWNLFF